MIQFGPADYSMSIGIPGERKHPRVLEAEKVVIETAQKKGLHPRAELADPADAKRYLDMGVKHFCIGTDVSILFDWFKKSGKMMRDMLGLEPAGGRESAGYGR
jgi:4-hydroxy-2-oxoheptanedioate aldolase